MQTIAKITRADYPDLLAAVDAGIPQRELARRYDCAPSLIARHVARAKRSREPREPVRGRDPGVTAEPHTGSMREILEARIRDPTTSARDLASLSNALAKLDGGKDSSRRLDALGLAVPFAPGSIVLDVAADTIRVLQVTSRQRPVPLFVGSPVEVAHLVLKHLAWIADGRPPSAPEEIEAAKTYFAEHLNPRRPDAEELKPSPPSLIGPRAQPPNGPTSQRNPAPEAASRPRGGRPKQRPREDASEG